MELRHRKKIDLVVNSQQARIMVSTNMAALDTDGTAQITGGTIIVLGALGEKGLSRGSGVSSYSLSLHSSGSHTVSI